MCGASNGSTIQERPQKFIFIVPVGTVQTPSTAILVFFGCQGIRLPAVEIAATPTDRFWCESLNSIFLLPDFLDCHRRSFIRTKIFKHRDVLSRMKNAPSNREIACATVAL
jgi:hypothetical protein